MIRFQKNVGLAVIALFFMSSFPLKAQDGPGVVEGGRWVPRGTFAISNLPSNELRTRTYARSDEERSRISTFLPGMTIVYQAQTSEVRQGYVVGITHSGIPVEVLDSELSTGKFSDRLAKDVVVHRAHQGCRDLACSGDAFTVGIGDSFSIIHEDHEKVELLNTDEKQVIYARSALEEREKRGFLTRHKDRVNPRWTITDGYASELSTGCGETRSAGEKLTSSVVDYGSNPLKWTINDVRWSIKAIEIFDLGTVVVDEENQTVIGHLSAPITGLGDENVAIDITLFSYRDSSWRPNFFKFAGILQIVHCERGRVGRNRPRYVAEAFLYFDMSEGDGTDQEFPLLEYELPPQLTREIQERIYGLTGRSFFYSINSSEEYERLFERLSEIIPYPTAVANVIARLNASCGGNDRPKCRAYSEALARAPLAKPMSASPAN